MLEFALDKIQALLDEGKITEETANSMAESFVNQYMTEGNSYNKAIARVSEVRSRNLDKYDQIDEKNARLNFMLDKAQDPKIRSFLDKQIRRNNDELQKIRNKTSDARHRYGLKTSENPEIEEPRFSTKHKNVRGLDPDIYKAADAQRRYTNRKKQWMEDHGNIGERPEDKYKAGRYLEIQKAMKESFDEMQLGLYEAADVGLLDPDFIPVMIEAVEFYLES